MPILITSTDLQKVNVKISPLAADNSPAIVTNQTWIVQNGDATLSVAPDGNSCFCISGAAGVVSTIAVSATNDKGDTLTDTITYTVTAETTAISLNLSADAPVAK